MKRICFYTSDYGYGHAARDIALIRKIQKAGFAEVFVKTDMAFDFMRYSLPDCNVIRQRNDIGPIFRDENIEIERDLTERALKTWLGSWDDYIKAERNFCNKNRIDLIISDIAPQPFLVAEDMGIPGIAFSNFTWHYIFCNLLGKVPAIERIKEAYMAGDLAIVLPFHEEMGLFKVRNEVPLVSRDITERRETLKTMLGLKEDELLIYLGVGKSLTSGIFNKLKNLDLNDIRLLISSTVELPSRMPQEKILKIPATETESQNYLAMVDLVVSKTGYSTVSEAIRGKVPMFLFRREGYEEDKLIARGVKKLGIGQEIQVKDFVEGKWIDELNDLDNYKNSFNRLNNIFNADGTIDTVETIRGMIL